MENFSCAIKCKQCRCVLESPVLLPCCHSVCKKHEQERKTIVCIECDTEYDVPKDGFPQNKEFALLIASGIFEKMNDLGPEHKSAINTCNKMKEIIEKVETLFKDPIYYVHERIGELKSRIDLAREEFKLKIDEEAETLLKKVEEYERDCKEKLKSSDDESKFKDAELKRELEATKLDLDNWTKYLDKFKVDSDEIENIQTKCNASIDNLQTQLDSFKNRLLMNKFDKTQEMIEGFENIQIFFDYKSPIKGELYETLDSKNDETQLIVLRDGTLACGNLYGLITIWNTDNETILRELIGHTKCIQFMKELSDGSLASASNDTTIKIWNPQNGQLLRSLESHTDKVWALEQLSNGLLASGYNDKTIKIWNVITGELLKKIDVGEKVYSLCLLRDGNLACIIETKLIILDPQSNQIVQTIKNDTFNRICLLSDGNLAICQTDYNITIWDVTSWKLLRTLRGHKDLNNVIKLLNDGSLASGSDDGEVKIWNPINGNLLKTIKVDKVPIYSIDQLSSGCLVTLSHNIEIWK